MNFNYYQEETRETAIFPEIGGARFLYPVMGLAGECGEILNKVKKIFRDRNGELSNDMREILADELGDVLWYLAQTAETLGLSLEDIAAMNLNKLQGRKSRGTLKGSGDKR
jgi:NTP pyrophosphatase (non-canonical NTP hydrolase)